MGETVSLKEHFESRIASVEKATTLAKDDMEKRLAGMNEFRDTLRDQAGKFITRDEMNIKFESVNKSGKENLSLLISLLSLIAVILIALFKL